MSCRISVCICLYVSCRQFCRQAATSIFFVATNVLSRQTRACRLKHVFVSTKHVFCRDKSTLVATKISWQQKDVAINVLWLQTRVCRHKTFVATKMILVAAPATDSLFSRCCCCCFVLFFLLLFFNERFRSFSKGTASLHGRALTASHS